MTRASIDTRKHHDFFQPEKVRDKIHIIGCGAIGSTVAELLVRLGLTNLVLYDYDIVEAKNVANQMFRQVDIGKDKTEALKDILVQINPELERTLQIEGKYENQKLDGYVFLAIDNIELRKSIVKDNRHNSAIKGVFDFRMRLEDAQHYAADWRSLEMQRELYATMDFTQEEAEEQTPVSACNETLSVAFTVRSIVTAGVENFVYFVKDRSKLKKSIYHYADNMENMVFDRTDALGATA